MSKIISNTKFNNVTCEVCNTVYAFEPGMDKVKIGYSEFYGYKMYLECPVCGKQNALEKEITK